VRHINKQEPDFYTKFISSEKPKNWDDFSIGVELRRYMLENEQNSQCAYTELRLNETNRSSHIDHFKRKHSSLYPQLTFDYNNLFTADISNDYGARHKDAFVKSRADYTNLLNPLSPDIQESFTYNLSNGEIEGRTENAQYTITVFKLNHQYLRRKRLDRIKMIDDYKDIYPLEDTIQYIGEFESLIRYIYAVN
jgi:uncharacterized protein (TIGR02646 family)